jgi:DNA-binding LacI/PurR family transcriptional regulator
MQDVARLAGVSTATVSAVINENKRVSPRRAQKVKDAIEALDYHADQNARSLRTGQTRVIGVVIPDMAHSFFAEVVAGAEEVASKFGYSFFLCDAHEDPALEQRHLDVLFSHRVEAVLIACCDSSMAYERPIMKRFPIVFFDRVPTAFRGSSVTTDNIAGAHMATRHLIECGHQEIAIIAGNLNRSTHAHRFEGFRKAMQESRLAIRKEYCGTEGLDAEAAYNFTLDRLRGPEPPTAIFCTSNKLLRGCVGALQQLHMRYPDDISIIGFDDFAWNETFHPAITTVAQPTREMGREAMELLLNKIAGRREGRDVAERAIVLQPELHVRNSTAPPRLSAAAPRRPGSELGRRPKI